MYIFRAVRLFVSIMVLVFPMLSCDMPANYGLVTPPIIFTTIQAEDQEWDIQVKPNVVYEVSIKRFSEKISTNYEGTLSFDSENFDCSFCKEWVSGSLQNGLVIYVLPKTSQIRVNLWGMGSSTQAILSIREVPSSEATYIATNTLLPIPTNDP